MLTIVRIYGVPRNISCHRLIEQLRIPLAATAGQEDIKKFVTFSEKRQIRHHQCDQSLKIG